MIEKQLFKDAKKIVNQYNNYSPSFLQRKLEIGYNRAVSIIEIIRPKKYTKLFSKKPKRVRDVRC